MSQGIGNTGSKDQAFQYWTATISNTAERLLIASILCDISEMVLGVGLFTFADESLTFNCVVLSNMARNEINEMDSAEKNYL